MQGNDLEDLVLLATSRFTVECNLIGSEVYKSFFNWSYGVAECETMFFVRQITKIPHFSGIFSKIATPIFQKYHTWEITPGSWAHQSQDRLSGLRLRVEDPVTAPVAATGVRLPR